MTDQTITIDGVTFTANQLRELIGSAGLEEAVHSAHMAGRRVERGSCNNCGALYVSGDAPETCTRCGRPTA